MVNELHIFYEPFLTHVIEAVLEKIKPEGIVVAPSKAGKEVA